jgi:diaminopimelate decarboxylase
VLIANVIGEKMAGDHRVVILDAAMNDLIRPALYKAWHEVVPLRLPAADAEWTAADIVGPICESTDKFADSRMMPPLAAGDRVAFLAAGAYGAVMASEYNGRPRTPEVVVQSQNWDFARKPRTYQDLIHEQSAPDWF